MLENRLGLMSPSDSGHVAEGTRQSNVKIHPPPTPWLRLRTWLHV